MYVTRRLVLLQDQRFRQFMKLCPKNVRLQLLALTETECSLNVSASHYMACAAEVYRAKGHFRRSKPTLNKLKSLKLDLVSVSQQFLKGQHNILKH